MSIGRFLYDNNKVKLYFDDVPEELQVPSMFFPIPELMPTIDSTSTFRCNYTMYVKIFEKTKQEAMTKANELAYKILKNKLKVPVVMEDGTVTKENIKLNNIQPRGVDDMAAQLAISWSSTSMFSSDENISGEKIEKLIIQPFLREG